VRRPVAQEYRVWFQALVLMCGAPLLAQAQTYPNKPIRFILPFAAGGAGDIMMRPLAQKMTEQWGQSVVLDSRSGASGAVGLQIAAHASADGYTLAMGTASTHAINPALHRDLPYDAIRDFAAIASLISIPNVLVAHPSVPARSLYELIQLARARPGQLSYASNGTGTSAHMAGEMLARAADIKLLHVPYKGAGIGVIDVLGGHVQLLFGGIPTTLPHVQSGKLKSLAVTGLQRSTAAPTVPTVAESGYPGFEVVQWFGAFAPAKTPRDIVLKLNADLNKAFMEPDFVKRMSAQGIDVTGGTPEQADAHVQAEVKRWGPVIKSAGIKAE